MSKITLTDIVLVACACFCAFGLVTDADSVADAADHLMKMISKWAS
jgi:hypothetical protein